MAYDNIQTVQFGGGMNGKLMEIGSATLVSGTVFLNTKLTVIEFNAASAVAAGTTADKIQILGSIGGSGKISLGAGAGVVAASNKTDSTASIQTLLIGY